MDPLSPALARFPLIARIRPACPPLPDRVARLVTRAEEAAATGDLRSASVVLNQAALLASDVGVPDLARRLCIDHATAFLDACPLPGREAMYGLEPMVNLARLRIRDQRPDEGRTYLLAMYAAVTDNTPATLDGVTLPAELTTRDEERQEIRKWLWSVLLADGTRTLTENGRWKDALAHIEEHHGVCSRMLDGRQVAVIAAITRGDVRTAHELLQTTAPGEDWEQVVTAVLELVALNVEGGHHPSQRAELVEAFLDYPLADGLTVPRTRLGLTIVDAIAEADPPAAVRIASDLFATTAPLRDGYAAREILAHPDRNGVLTPRQIDELSANLAASGLDAGHIAPALHTALTGAALNSREVISVTLARPVSL
ncbi:hypothetical protein ABIA32_006309 [Streptacidiphilus sp. MAP12-20]|uniref:hypothetical protein n=1 Tax=Streptacidiphilus sp. MAP12-20 TaxID=3156299 RepID=UPI003514C13C